MTWDRRLYFPSEGRRAEDFYLPLKNLTASAVFEPANLGTKSQHATSRPPKPLMHVVGYTLESFTMDRPLNVKTLQCVVVTKFNAIDTAEQKR